MESVELGYLAPKFEITEARLGILGSVILSIVRPSGCRKQVFLPHLST
ncbi:uncharacterized protein G2W53_033952 [Senna tora]|uniref:Uncharacterized protein n=1 Tax=Senna tora TaxID=362788 RepID=A0A834WBG2_9FABA|nr:uncharacterized protein G2W53_033952 [Senna tora]